MAAASSSSMKGISSWWLARSSGISFSLSGVSPRSSSLLVFIIFPSIQRSLSCFGTGNNRRIRHGNQEGFTSVVEKRGKRDAYPFSYRQRIDAHDALMHMTLCGLGDLWTCPVVRLYAARG